jgi:hypothetical protein
MLKLFLEQMSEFNVRFLLRWNQNKPSLYGQIHLSEQEEDLIKYLGTNH